MSLTPRQAKKQQMVRAGYAGVGIGVVLIVIAVSAASIILGLIGAILVLAAGWAARTLRSL
ncbi:MAG TPA: hypothetical protein VE777_10230 [Gaiellales bacterium]|jgi:hypothetical protein|nr:hypothetical protein [Gaiellales bacterium]